MIMTDDERYRFEERAAICEYDGKLTREEAEQIAAKEVEEERRVYESETELLKRI